MPVWTLVRLNTESVILYRQISVLGTLLAYSVRRTCRHYFNVTNYSPRAYWRLCSLKDPLMSLRQRRRCSIYYSDYDSSVCAVTGHFAPRKQPPPWLWFRVRPVLRPVCSTRAELNWTLKSRTGVQFLSVHIPWSVNRPLVFDTGRQIYSSLFTKLVAV